MASSRLLWVSSRAASSSLRISSILHRGFATVVEGLKDSQSHDQLVKVNANNTTDVKIVAEEPEYSDYFESVKVDAEDAKESCNLPYGYRVVEGFKYSNTHEWAKVVGNTATVGITDFGRYYKFPNRHMAAIAGHVHNVNSVDLPTVGADVSQGNSFGKLFLDKYIPGTEPETTAVLYSPISGKVVEVGVKRIPSDVFFRPYGYGWMMKVEMKDASELKKLMDADDYIKFCEEEKVTKCLKEMQIRENAMKGLKYSDSHMWVKVDGNEITVGMNGQRNFRGGYWNKLPKVGEQVSQGYCVAKYLDDHEHPVRAFGFVSPVSGKVVEVNDKWDDVTYDWRRPLSPYEEGWIMKVKVEDVSELEKLMNVDDYTKFCDENDANWGCWCDEPDFRQFCWRCRKNITI